MAEEEREYIICTSKDSSICVACEIKGDLNCRYNEELVKCFRNRHLPFRALQFIVIAFAVLFITSLFWTFLLFAVVITLNFVYIETWYLCRHCPFYEKEGSSLECVTLKGLPKFWPFDPAPMKKSEKRSMTLVGGFIDIFPILVSGYTSWVLFSFGADSFSTLLMVSLTLISLVAAGYIEKFLRENFCERCVNLSCMMNKVPDELKEEYLRKNPGWLRVWEDSGYVSGNKLEREKS
ncbi:MAG: hypothetical protein ACFFE6_13840 [Candidatus Thorarchaeota archaeon]